MKKIKIILFFIFLLLINSAEAIVPVVNIEEEYDYSEYDTKSVYESPVFLEEENSINLPLEAPTVQNFSFYEKTTNIIKNVYSLQIETNKVPTSLFSNYLTKDFETGPIEKMHIWGVVQSNMDLTFEEGHDVDTKFRAGLVNVLLDGKMRGGQEDFRLMLDATPNSTTGFWNRFVRDAYIQTRRVPHHAILFGNSRTGVGIEGAQSPYTLPLLTRAQISRHFGNARKVGVRVRGDYILVDYDIGGYSSDTEFSEFMPGTEFNGWVNFKPFANIGDKFGNFVVGGGLVSGERNSTDFFVTGANVGYEYKKMWLRAEFADADGSNGGTGLTSKKRQGWYAAAGYQVTPKIELVARYDEFNPDKKISHNNRQEYSTGINYYVKGQALKLVLNYIYCKNQNTTDTHRFLVGTQLAL